MVEPAGPANWEAAWQIGVSYRDQDFSIVDRASFAAMLRLGVERGLPLTTTLPFSGLARAGAGRLR
jgi:hypothetical protein